MKTYRTFDSIESAISYRHENGTGGWIFLPVTDKALGDESILFPAEFTPCQIMNHVLTRGFSGKLI